jgi:hypothetical protein
VGVYKKRVFDGSETADHCLCPSPLFFSGKTMVMSPRYDATRICFLIVRFCVCGVVCVAYSVGCKVSTFQNIEKKNNLLKVDCTHGVVASCPWPDLLFFSTVVCLSLPRNFLFAATACASPCYSLSPPPSPVPPLFFCDRQHTYTYV